MPGSWQLLQLTLPRARVSGFLELLTDLGTIGVEERPAQGEAWPVRQPWDEDAPSTPPPDRVELLAYFERGAREDERQLTVQAAIDTVPGATMALGVLNEGDWEESWRSAFHPLVVAPGVVIAPPWEPEAGALVIEPGSAFGTGQHPTTLACLRAVALHARPGQTMLDVGCGTGVLALLAARRGMNAHGVDTDPQAVAASRTNAMRNDLACTFDGRSVRTLPGRYDLVVANIYAEVLVRLSSDLVRLTGRRLVLAGILADRAPQVERAMRPLSPARRAVDGDWLSLELVRP